jgi:predicted RNA-binding protein with TRAM domain
LIKSALDPQQPFNPFIVIYITPPTKPVDFGKVYEVDITEITGKGYTIARVQGFIVFIVNGKIGNRIKLKVTEVVDRFAKATIEA